MPIDLPTPPPTWGDLFEQALLAAILTGLVLAFWRAATGDLDVGRMIATPASALATEEGP